MNRCRFPDQLRTSGFCEVDETEPGTAFSEVRWPDLVLQGVTKFV